MPHLTAEQIARYHRKGFLLIPGVFTPAEIAGLQSAAARHHPEGAYSNPIFGVPGLEHLWRDPRLTAIAADLLGEKIAFFGQADYVRYIFGENEHILGRHAHHDGKGTVDNLFNRTHTARGTVYPVVRFGIYFQDCADASGGLKVAPCSHLMDTSAFAEDRMQYFNIPSRPGDLICFCARVIHSPFALRLKDEPNAALSPHQEDQAFARAPGLFLPAPSLRETIFIDYAAPSVEADLLIKNRAVFIPPERTDLAFSYREQDLQAWAEKSGMRIRLDFAAIETVHAIMRAGRTVEASAPLLRSLRDLVALSREWSPHHSLFSGAPDSDDLGVLLSFSETVFARVLAFKKASANRASDIHMGALTREAIKAIA